MIVAVIVWGWLDLQAAGSARGTAELVGWRQRSAPSEERPSGSVPAAVPCCSRIYLPQTVNPPLITRDLLGRNEDQWQQINTNDLGLVWTGCDLWRWGIFTRIIWSCVWFRLKIDSFRRVTVAEHSLAADVIGQGTARGEFDGPRHLLIIHHVIFGREAAFKMASQQFERNQRTRSEIRKGHFKTEKLNLLWRMLANVAVQPSIFIYLPRSGAHWQQAPGAAQSFLSVTHDFCSRLLPV